MSIINSNPIQGVNLIILHNNEYAILNRIAYIMVKKHSQFIINCNTDALKCREHHFDANSPDKGCFLSSSIHFEFELSNIALEYIKNIVKNKPITNSEFIFVIKNADNNINKNLYLELRRLIDTSHAARWILTTERHTFLDQSIQSRALLINCCFPLENIMKCCKLQNTLEHYYPIYLRTKGNVVTFLQLISTSHESMLWQDTFDKFMTELLVEKKQLNVILHTREMVYKLYHIGLSFTEFCRYVVIKYGESIKDIIPLIAKCEHENSKFKECLMYEKVILELYSTLKLSCTKKSKVTKTTKTTKTTKQGDPDKDLDTVEGDKKKNRTKSKDKKI